MSMKKCGSRKDPGWAWKIQMCVGDEVQRKKEDLCPAPRLLLWLEPKRDPGKVRVCLLYTSDAADDYLEV